MTEERTRTHRQLAGEFQAAQAEIDRMKAAASDAAASDAAAGDTAAGDAAAGDTAAVATHINARSSKNLMGQVRFFSRKKIRIT